MTKLSEKSRLRLLWLLAALFTLVAYRLAVHPTLEMYGQYRMLEEQHILMQGPMLSQKGLAQKLAYYEGMLSGYRLDSASRSDRLLSILSPLCKAHRVRLLTLPPVQKEMAGEYYLSTRVLQLEGNFKDLLRVVHALEQAGNAGRIASVRFSTLEDPMGGVKALRAEVFLQQLLEAAHGRETTITKLN